MEQLLRVDFASNRVEKTRAEWIQELIEYELDCLDTAENSDATMAYLLMKGFVGYENMNDNALIDQVYDMLGHNYHIEEAI